MYCKEDEKSFIFVDIFYCCGGYRHIAYLYIYLSILLYMKKHRILNKTDHSFFSNNTFQLKPTEQPKERSRRKSNLINHLKNQISSSDSRYLLKDKST